MIFNFKNKSPMEVSIEYEQGLSDSELKEFRSAIDHYRKGDKLQAGEYDKANRILQGSSDDIEEISEELNERGEENGQ